jgi:hypothetical protein
LTRRRNWRRTLSGVIRRKPEQVRELLWRGLEAHRAAETLDEKRLAFETLKAAKISSETLTNLQRMERISHGLDNQGGKVELVIERSYGVMEPGAAGRRAGNNRPGLFRAHPEHPKPGAGITCRRFLFARAAVQWNKWNKLLETFVPGNR